MDILSAANLRKKARKKYLTNAMKLALVKVGNSPLNKNYAISLACCETLIINHDQSLRSMFYCKQRWCSTCQSIKMATLINKHIKSLKQLNDPMFVTLTVPTLHRASTAEDISKRVSELNGKWRKITDLARKQRIDFQGIRKVEVKITERKEYHTHYHIIVGGGETCAAWLVHQWLRLNANASRKAQDITHVNDMANAMIELMKYTTKLPTAEDTDNNSIGEAWQLDRIFTGLKGKRLYQTFGGLEQVAEDDFELSKEVVSKASGLYKWAASDWVHMDYNQMLTGYVPDDDDVRIATSM